MDFVSMTDISKTPEIPEIKHSEGDIQFSKESLYKFDKLMGDDSIEVKETSYCEKVPKLDPVERENKFDNMFDTGDFFSKPEVNAMTDEAVQKYEAKSKDKESCEQSADIYQKREPDLEYELYGDIYKTDDNGNTYKKNGELIPNTEYTVNGNTYRTDKHGRKIECTSNPEYTKDGVRNNKEQRESGGAERQENDEGGHIIARTLGGSEGNENLVPIRKTINHGDYKKMENEITKALKSDKEVSVHTELKYNEDSQRPSKIISEYTIDGNKTVVEFDNKKNSTELVESLDSKISSEDYNNLKAEIHDMKADGVDASITSVKTEYDDNGNYKNITVGLLNESTKEKTYKVYKPVQEA